MAEDRTEEGRTLADPQIPRYYVNQIGIGAGPIDIAIEFGYQVGSGVREPLAQVAMSWEEALVLRDFLTLFIDDYQEKVGPIRRLQEVPESVDQAVADAQGAATDAKGGE